MGVKNDVLDKFIDELLKHNINELSKKTGIHRNTIAGWYNYKHIPSINQFIVVAKEIGYEVVLVKEQK